MTEIITALLNSDLMNATDLTWQQIVMLILYFTGFAAIVFACFVGLLGLSACAVLKALSMYEEYRARKRFLRFFQKD